LINPLKKIIPKINLFSKILIVGILCIGLLWISKTWILQYIGSYLVVQNSPQKCTYIFVLGGNPQDRGFAAAEYWKQGYFDTIVCLGKPNFEEQKRQGVVALETNPTRPFLLEKGVPESRIKIIPYATSSHEEREFIIFWCRQRKQSTVAVVTSEMHTRRVLMHFKEKMKSNNINLILLPAAEPLYNVNNWWKSEQGLIFVNNEYLKIIWYLTHY
jgi:uncharacterized SAM-binding protein YcdF (DUF218 family)